MTEKKQRDEGPVKALLMITQIAFSMMVPMGLCIAIGIFLDSKLETSFLTLVFAFVGIATAFRNVYHLTSGFYKKNKAKEDAELKYFEDLRARGEANRKRKS